MSYELIFQERMTSLENLEPMHAGQIAEMWGCAETSANSTLRRAMARGFVSFEMRREPGDKCKRKYWIHWKSKK